MSLRGDGAYRCDRCGADVGNAAVDVAAVVTDLDPYSEGLLRYLHLCRAGGCAAAVLGPENLIDWEAAR